MINDSPRLLKNAILSMLDRGISMDYLEDARFCLKNHSKTFLKPPGEEHYALLSCIAYEVDGVNLYDIGTYRGLSALALAANYRNKVITYDIDYFVDIHRPDNVEFRIGNFYTDAKNLLESPFIFVDIDPHDGIQEIDLHYYLIDNHYKGLVLYDDIHQFDGMRKFWSNVRLEKYDLTKIGHWSGSGLAVYF